MSPRIFQRRPVHLRVRDRLIDEALGRYLEWRAESDAVEQAYAVWSHAPADDGAYSFAFYQTALDREEFAAIRYGAVIDRLERLPDADAGLAAAGAGAA